MTTAVTTFRHGNQQQNPTMVYTSPRNLYMLKNKPRVTENDIYVYIFAKSEDLTRMELSKRIDV